MSIAISIPAPVTQRLNELNQLVESNPVYIPLVQAAAFLGVEPASLRCCIERGQCPFGISWQKDVQHGKTMSPGTRAFKIPSVTFYLWYTHGIAYRN